MTQGDFAATVQEYRVAAANAAEARHAAAVAEIDRSTWLAREIDALIGNGAVNPRTSKSWSWTAAESYVRDSEDHRERQLDVCGRQMAATKAESEARALAYICRYLTRDGVSP